MIRPSVAFAAVVLVLFPPAAHSAAPDGNRLTYLDSNDPYYPSRTFPKLLTRQWVGEEGVEAVVVLAIDDMRDSAKYEAYLRPILDRLKQIDGRAPVSVMSNRVDPADPKLTAWLKEGLSIEVHTFDHPCPLLKDGDFAKAKETYEKCVDLMNAVPGSRAVAFRMPCCDSRNTVSPRFYSEIFNRTTAAGGFLTIDSSVFNLITADDPELPRELVFNADGTERFRRYVPFPSFANTIEDYPYPYVINRLCWQFPCVAPSDWSAQHVQRPHNPRTVADWKLALDATVIKGGVFNLVFHPHNWIRPQQVVELIDHAVAKHGGKVKFLTFREAQDRLDQNLLAGQPLRAANGQDNGVRLLDVNADGYMDVVIGNEHLRRTRVWSPKQRRWLTTETPFTLVQVAADGKRSDAGVRFGTNGESAIALVRNEKESGGWYFDGEKWSRYGPLLNGLEIDGKPLMTAEGGRDRGVRLRDIDRDGKCELIVGNVKQKAVFAWERVEKQTWSRLPFDPSEPVVDEHGRDAGLRFVDVNDDGLADTLFSTDFSSSLHLFRSLDKGWDRLVSAQGFLPDAVPVEPGGPIAAPADREGGVIPRIVRGGTDNGAWFMHRTMWVQNEDTAGLPDLVERRTFNDMLAGVFPEPKSPEASLVALRARPGFTVELVAAEPLVTDPIAFAWGADGKLWVVEMGDYPLGAGEPKKPGGRVRFLEDADGDGRYEKSTLFLDGLSFPTGVTPWRDGVLVTCAPDILFAADTDGDGKADKREVLFTGFGEGNQQHRVNGLAYGLDNWLYGANGDSGGKIKSTKTGKVTDISRRDFRIRPDTGEIEPVTGQTQFGRSRDDWGNWFGGNNSNPMWHFVLEDGYLRRNPHLAPPDVRVNVPQVPGAAPVFPRSYTGERFNDFDRANRFTSACSPVVYREGEGGLFGPMFSRSTFVAEPVHNLVHREIIEPAGVTFTSRRADDEQRSEFLASTDPWFRPTWVTTGPDGAVWVADMYRHVIEHPQWIPKEWQAKLDLHAGHDKGRIYRVFPVGTKPRAIPRLDRMDTAQLAAALESPSGWTRDMAQQLLVERADAAVIEPLRRIVSASASPLGRLHALCTLDGLGKLADDDVRKGLADAHPGVRRHAVRLAEARLGVAGIGESLVKLAKDADPFVRLQAAYSLGAWVDERAADALADLLCDEQGDVYLRTAALSSLRKESVSRVLSAIATRAPPQVTGQVAAMARQMGGGPAVAAALAHLVGTRGETADDPRPYAVVADFADALQEPRGSLDGVAAADKSLLDALKAMTARARAVVAAERSHERGRAAAVRVLGRLRDEQTADLAVLDRLLAPQVPPIVQEAAVAAIQRADAEPAKCLIASWKTYSPQLRRAVVEQLVARADAAAALLDAIDGKQVAPHDLDAAHRDRLLKHGTKSVRDRAAKALADLVNPDRQKVLDALRPALALKGDAARGAPVFAKACATCHRLGDAGHAVGPDLAALAGRSPEELLIAIIDPNRAVEARFVNYVIDTRDGQTLTGIISAESGNSLTLLMPEGRTQQVLRGDIGSLRGTNLSMMPEGLETGLQPQDVADLLAFIRAPPAAPTTRPGELIKPKAP